MRRIRQNRLAQATLEYILIICIVLAAIIAAGFVGHMRAAFNTCFDKAAAKMR